MKFDFKLKISSIPIISALPMFILCEKRWKILRSIDSETIAFFVGMFIVTDTLAKNTIFENITESGRLINQ